MSTPSKTRTDTLRALRAARRDLTSAAWLSNLKRQPLDVRREAAHKLLDVEEALLELGSAELSDIRDQLIDNEQELAESLDALEQARTRLNRVQTFLTQLGAFLETVKKIVTFVATS